MAVPMYMVVDKQRDIPNGDQINSRMRGANVELDLSMLEVSIPKEGSSTKRGRKEIIALREWCSLSQNAAGHSENDQRQQEKSIVDVIGHRV
jgi:hypothetical protein